MSDVGGTAENICSLRVFRLLTPNGRSRRATDARDILSLICRFCIFVVRNVALSSCSVMPAWPPRSSRAVGRLPSISISHFHGGPTMNGRDALKFGAAILVVVSAEIPASAQDRLEKRLDRLEARSDARKSTRMKMTTDIPPSITNPDKVETRIGTLKFFDGFPDKATCEKVYDNLVFKR